MITTIVECERCGAEAKFKCKRTKDKISQGYIEYSLINFKLDDSFYYEPIIMETDSTKAILLCPDCQKLYKTMLEEVCSRANSAVEEFFKCNH